MRSLPSWKYALCVAVAEAFLLASPGLSQDAASPSNSPTAPNPKTFVAEGMSKGSSGDLDGAIEAFKAAIQIDPKYAAAYYGLGFAYAIQNKPDDAIAAYGQAIQLDPKYKDAYYQRGVLKGLKADFDGAADDFKQVVKLDPHFATAYYNLGHALYFKGDLDGAIDQINQALTLNPNFPYAYFIHGLIRRTQGRRIEALADFQKSQDLGFPDAAYWVWIENKENGKQDDAKKALSDAMAKPDLIKPNTWTYQIGSYLLGIVTQDQLVAKAHEGDDGGANDRLCDAWFYAGMVDRFAGDTKGAQNCFAQAIATGSKGSDEFVEANREAAKLATPP